MNPPPDTPPSPPPGLAEPILRESPPFTALCLTTRGPYWKLSGPFRRLRMLQGELGVTPAGPSFGVFYDDPDRVPADETRFSLCCPLARDTGPAAASRLGDIVQAAGLEPGDAAAVQDFPPARLAVLEYRGPAADSAVAYARLASWLNEQSLTAEGPPREVYLAEPGTLGKGLMHVEVLQPLAPAAR